MVGASGRLTILRQRMEIARILRAVANPRAVPPQVWSISTPGPPPQRHGDRSHFQHFRDREVWSGLEPAGIRHTRIEMVMTFS